MQSRAGVGGVHHGEATLQVESSPLPEYGLSCHGSMGVVQSEFPLARTGDIMKTVTLWKDIKLPLHHPYSTWKLSNAARWFEDLLKLPTGTVVFMRPDGQRAKLTDTVGSLRSKVTSKKSS